MESKVIIINPSDEEYGLIDGEIKYLGEVNSDFFHEDLLINYGYEVYGEGSIFKVLHDGNYLVDIPVYFLTEQYDNVVFLNISSSKNGKAGLLYLPTDISEKQIQSLKKLSSVLKDYKIEVNYNMAYDDGLVDSDRRNMKGIDETVIKQKKA